MKWKVHKAVLAVVMFAIALAVTMAVIWAIAPARAETGAVASDGGTALIDLTGLAQAIIAVLCVLVTRKVLPWIEANTTEKQRGAFQAAIDTAVYAAEQLYKTNVVTDRLEYAQRWLRERG